MEGIKKNMKKMSCPRSLIPFLAHQQAKRGYYLVVHENYPIIIQLLGEN